MTVLGRFEQIPAPAGGMAESNSMITLNILSLKLMPRLHVCRFDNLIPNEKIVFKVFSCCQGHVIFCLWKGLKACSVGMKLSFKTWEIFYHKRQVSFLVAPLSLNAALDNTASNFLRFPIKLV